MQNRSKRSRARGVTLVEVMIVVVILSLISAGVAIAVLPYLAKGQRETTIMAARTIRAATDQYRAQHEGTCPTVETLVHESLLDRSSKLTDAWDARFEITCAPDGTTVASNGRDRLKGTEDDLRVPDERTGALATP